MLEFLFKFTLFVKKYINGSIVSTQKYIIISNLAMLLKDGKHEETQIFLVLFGPSSDQILESKIKIPNDWTPQNFLGDLSEEAKADCTISLSLCMLQGNDATNDIFNLRSKYCNINT